MKILEPNSTVEFCVFTTTVALPLYYIKETYTIPSQVSTDVQNRGFKKSRIKMYNKKIQFWELYVPHKQVNSFQS